LGKTIPDFRISSLSELKPIIRKGLPLSAGKLPNDILSEFLDEFFSPETHCGSLF